MPSSMSSKGRKKKGRPRLPAAQRRACFYFSLRKGVVDQLDGIADKMSSEYPQEWHLTRRDALEVCVLGLAKLLKSGKITTQDLTSKAS